MRRSDILKQQGINRQTRERLETTKVPQQSQPDNSNQVGMAMVIDSVSWGKGSICALEILSNGRSTGIRYNNAKSYSPVNVGSVVSFARRPDNTIEVISGGNSTSTSTTTTTTTGTLEIHSHQNVYSGGFLSGFGGGM